LLFETLLKTENVSKGMKLAATMSRRRGGNLDAWS